MGWKSCDGLSAEKSFDKVAEPEPTHWQLELHPPVLRFGEDPPVAIDPGPCASHDAARVTRPSEVENGAISEVRDSATQIRQ